MGEMKIKGLFKLHKQNVERRKKLVKEIVEILGVRGIEWWEIEFIHPKSPLVQRLFGNGGLVWLQTFGPNGLVNIPEQSKVEILEWLLEPFCSSKEHTSETPEGRPDEDNDDDKGTECPDCGAGDGFASFFAFEKQ